MGLDEWAGGVSVRRGQGIPDRARWEVIRSRVMPLGVEERRTGQGADWPAAQGRDGT